MFSTKHQKVFILLLTLFFIKHSETTEKQNNINEIEDTFQRIEVNHNKLKKLFKDAILKQAKKVIEENEENEDGEKAFNEGNDECICVPFYLCDNGDIIKDGSQLLEFRSGINPCYNIGDICCEPYLINNTMKAVEDSKCGYSTNIITNDTNVDPKAAKFGEFPWTVMITTDKLKYKCVGSLIHPQVVLTAAHCINVTENYTVRVGEWDASNKNEPYSHQAEDVTLIIKHPKFNVMNLFYDVALLVVENPFELQENIKTACLADAAPSALRILRNECAASGWGMEKLNTGYSRKMKKVELSLIVHKTCEQNLRKTRLGKWFELHQGFVCALGHHGYDVCQGDGGAPLVCPIPGQPGRYQQVGITSWGIGCGDEGTPSVFSRLTHIRSWIDFQFDMLKFSKDYYTYQRST